MNKFYGTKVTITGEFKYIGEGDDLAKDPWVIAFKKAVIEIYQPERLNPEDAVKSVCDSLSSMET